MRRVIAFGSLLRPDALGAMRLWPLRRWAAAIGAGTLVAVLIGIPTGIVANPLYHRMTPATWWDYPVWGITAVLGGLTAATYVRAGRPESEKEARKVTHRSMGATIFAGLAVGCPICNKIVVALVGVSGALNYWAPLQPLIGVLSVALLLAGLMFRLRGEIACPRPAV